MGYADPFLLGPLGRMRALPSPPGAGMGANYARVAGEHRSLRGGTTLDLLGVQREWSFPYDYRTDPEAAHVIARYTSPLTTEPLRLLDPMVPNRLSIDLASGGGATGTVDGQGVSSGPAPTRIRPDTRPTVLDGLLDGGFRWQPSSAATDWYLTLDWRVPVEPGEAIVFRGWLRGAGTTTVVPFIRRYNAANVYADTLGTPLALTASWVEFAVPVTVDAGRISAVVGLHVDAGASGRVIDLMAPQCGLAAQLPAGEWQPGGGAPAVVVVGGLDHAYQRLGRHAMTFTLREI